MIQLPLMEMLLSMTMWRLARRIYVACDALVRRDLAGYRDRIQDLD